MYPCSGAGAGELGAEDAPSVSSHPSQSRKDGRIDLPQPRKKPYSYLRFSTPEKPYLQFSHWALCIGSDASVHSEPA